MSRLEKLSDRFYELSPIIAILILLIILIATIVPTLISEFRYNYSKAGIVKMHKHDITPDATIDSIKALVSQDDYIIGYTEANQHAVWTRILSGNNTYGTVIYKLEDPIVILYQERHSQQGRKAARERHKALVDNLINRNRFN